MASGIEAQLAASTQLVEGGGGVFDVRVNGELVYSKHQTGEFPDEERLIQEIKSTYGP